MTGLSFLGTGNYQPTFYQYKNRKFESAYFPVALHSLFSIDELFVVMTKEAKEKHGSELKKHLEYIEILIPSGKNEAEYYDMFEAIISRIPENKPLIVDVTHGFRSQPMIALASIVFMRFYNSVDVEGVYYGAYESRNIETNRSPVFDLTPFLDVIDWTFAIRRFKEKGDASEMSYLMKELHRRTYIEQHDYKAKRLQAAGKYFSKMTDALSVIRPAEVTDYANHLKDMLPDLRSDLDNIPQTSPLALMFDDIENTVQKFTTSKRQGLFTPSGIRMQCTMLNHYIEVGNSQQALTLTIELCLSIACIYKNLDPLKKENRDDMSGRFYKIINSEVSYHEDSIDSWEPELAEVADLATQYRNDVNHAGMRKDPKPATVIIEKSKELVNRLQNYIDKNNSDSNAS